MSDITPEQYPGTRPLELLFNLAAKIAEYVKLIDEELGELAVSATLRGWKSSRVERGQELRREIASLLGQAIWSRESDNADRACNACSWTGKESDCVYCGSVGPLCPECHETTDVILLPERE